MTLDGSLPAAAEIIGRLTMGADVVVANLPIRVLQKICLDYDALRAIKPNIILAHFRTAFGIMVALYHRA
jgi:crotonobetainyl-CoA:carnitine CoA-transferase CaiB-like acyl-CoA transferase